MATIKRLHKNFRWLDLEVAPFQRNVIRRSLVKHLNIFSRSITCNDPILKFIEILTNRLVQSARQICCRKRSFFEGCLILYVNSI